MYIYTARNRKASNVLCTRKEKFLGPGKNCPKDRDGSRTCIYLFTYLLTCLLITVLHVQSLPNFIFVVFYRRLFTGWWLRAYVTYLFIYLLTYLLTYLYV